jgi:hypothetical protein
VPGALHYQAFPDLMAHFVGSEQVLMARDSVFVGFVVIRRCVYHPSTRLFQVLVMVEEASGFVVVHLQPDFLPVVRWGLGY